MKRADAIQKIENLIHQYRDYNGLQIEASQILDIIESIGMKPPCVSEEDAQALMHIYIDPCFYRWDEDLEKDERVQEDKRRTAEVRARRVKGDFSIRSSADGVVLDSATIKKLNDILEDKNEKK